MNKTYFIDSENVGDLWISLLSGLDSEDDILVFYTSKSPHMNYKNVILLKQSDIDVTFIECSEGNNALDFQLATDLGYRVHNISDREFMIVSNDTGFDAIVKYWRQRGKSVSRISGKDCCISESPSQTPKLLPAPPKASECTSNNMVTYAKEILYIIGKKNLQDLHESLKQLFGNKEYKAIYNSMKKEKVYDAFLAHHKQLTLAEKQSSYCSIVFSVMAPSEKMPENFSKFILHAWRSKKKQSSLKTLLQEKYGTEKGALYASLFKIHIKILDKIK